MVWSEPELLRSNGVEEKVDEAKRIEVFRVNSEGGSRMSLIIIYRIFE